MRCGTALVTVMRFSFRGLCANPSTFLANKLSLDSCLRTAMGVEFVEGFILEEVDCTDCGSDIAEGSGSCRTVNFSLTNSFAIYMHIFV